MWARVVEMMLAMWLLLSPFIFRLDWLEDRVHWGICFGAAFGAFTLGALSMWMKTRRAHLGQLVLGLALAGWGYLAAPDPPPPIFQNELVVGVLLLMFAIIPTEALDPPEPWRMYYTWRRPQGEGQHNPPRV